MQAADERFPGWHGTTIVAVKKDGKVAVAGDGQVSLGETAPYTIELENTRIEMPRMTPGITSGASITM